MTLNYTTVIVFVKSADEACSAVAGLRASKQLSSADFTKTTQGYGDNLLNPPYRGCVQALSTDVWMNSNPIKSVPRIFSATLSVHKM